MVNHGLTKEVILCPTKKTITAEEVAALFFHKVYLCFRFYNKIICNHGSQFSSVFAKELGKLLTYDLSLSTTYHPQSDSKTEHIVRCKTIAMSNSKPGHKVSCNQLWEFHFALVGTNKVQTLGNKVVPRVI